MAVGGQDFRRWLGREDGSLTNGVSGAMRRGQRANWPFPVYEETTSSRPSTTWETASTRIGNLISGFQPPELWKVNVCFSSHSVYAVLSQQPRLNMRNTICIRGGEELLTANVRKLTTTTAKSRAALFAVNYRKSESWLLSFDTLVHLSGGVSPDQTKLCGSQTSNSVSG